MGFEVQLKLMHLGAVIRVGWVPFRQVLADPEQITDADLQSGLFFHLPAGGLGSRLTGLYTSARQNMELSVIIEMPDEEDSALLVHDDCASTDPQLGLAST